MNIGIISQNSKRALLEDFCIAYKGILSRHDIYATATTARRIEEVTGLRVHKFLSGMVGGDKQFTEMVERGDMDMAIYFYNPSVPEGDGNEVYRFIRVCDAYNVPIATNLATAESLILGLANGDLDWRIEFRKD